MHIENASLDQIAIRRPWNLSIKVVTPLFTPLSINTLVSIIWGSMWKHLREFTGILSKCSATFWSFLCSSLFQVLVDIYCHLKKANADQKEFFFCKPFHPISVCFFIFLFFIYSVTLWHFIQQLEHFSSQTESKSLLIYFPLS